MSFFQRLASRDVSRRVDSLQLIDGQGNFDAAGLDAFAKYIKLAECGLSYAVVAIMGPQSSGKSTLLNHLFSTSFTEMDAFIGRNQTTQGIWVARAAGVEPCTVVMDLEGTDGGERGEDDTAFEKQSALFALAVADILLINMWCHDIGREQAANKPLLKIVFQVMMRLFSPRKTTLLFVIRDKTRTPMEILEPRLREDVNKIWGSVPKPSELQDATLEDCFNVQVTGLSNFEDKPEVFKDQVADLRERFNDSIAQGGLAGDRRGVVPGTAFPVSVRSIWDIIRENKDLDLPAHKVMVATVRCEEIANEKLAEFLQNEEWTKISEGANDAAIPGFGTRISTLLDKYISDYDQEVSYFDENVRTSKRNFLLQQTLETVQPAYQQMLSHHRGAASNKFKHDLKDWADSSNPEVTFAVAVRQCKGTALGVFDDGIADAHVTYARWDASKLREKLVRDMDAHAASVRSDKINAIVSSAQNRLKQNVGESTSALLESATLDTWPAIRDLLTEETQHAQSSLRAVLTGYELDEAAENNVLQGLASFGRTVVEAEAKKEASQALLRMKDRFTTRFSHDSESLPRLWSVKDDVRAIAKDARSSSLKGLSVIAAVRLDGKTSDPIEPALATLLDPHDKETQKALEAATDSESSSVVNSNPLAASSWDGIPVEQTLLTPTQCRNIWKQFKSETDYAITQALTAQEASRNGKSWLPPPWAIAAMIVLGFNEFMALLRNPLYLLVFFVIYLLGRALWVQLDLKAEFRHGIMPGMLSVSSKIVPTVMNFLTKLAEEGSRAGGTNQRPGNSSTYSSPHITRRGSELHDFSQDLDDGHLDDSEGSVRSRQRRRTVRVDE